MNNFTSKTFQQQKQYSFGRGMLAFARREMSSLSEDKQTMHFCILAALYRTILLLTSETWLDLNQLSVRFKTILCLFATSLIRFHARCITSCLNPV